MRDMQQVKELHTCENCDTELYPNDEVYKHDNTYFCDEDCLLVYIKEGDSVKKVIL